MSTSKCEKSEHRKEIDEAAKNGMSARKISDMLLVKFNEHMSHTAIHNYLDKSKSLDEESAIEAVENLEKRVRNLELNAVTYGPNGSDNGWNTYSLAGTQSHALSPVLPNGKRKTAWRLAMRNSLRRGLRMQRRKMKQ
jgi:hypothetical protein